MLKKAISMVLPSLVPVCPFGAQIVWHLHLTLLYGLDHRSCFQLIFDLQHHNFGQFHEATW